MSTPLQAKFDELLSWDPPQGDYLKIAAAPANEVRQDGWSNSATGIGTSKDKVSATQFTPGGTIPWTVLDNLYHNDDVCSRFVESRPKYAFRKGISFSDKKVAQRFDELKIAQVFRDSWTFVRLYGGGKTYVSIAGQSPATPATPGQIQALKYVDPFQISPTKFYTDGPKVGEPEIYTMTPRNIATGASPIEVHETRLISWPGALTSPLRKVSNNYWDDSVVQRVYWAMQAYGITWGTVVHILQDVAQGVYGIKNLWQYMISKQQAVIEDRLKQVDQQKSSGQAIAIDKDNETYERKGTPVSGVAELIDRMTERLASAFETPITILMGSSPAGMNATGESDLENWYGSIEAEQVQVVLPNVKRVLYLDSAPAEVEACFPSLWSLSDKEMSEARYTNARADQLWYTIGAMTGDEARKSAAKNSPAAQVDATKPAGKSQPMLLAEAAAKSGVGDKTPNEGIPKSHYSPADGH